MFAESTRLGLGTTGDGEWGDVVRSALEMGYRHVDTAQGYGNEAKVGRGIKDADVSREEVFLATKTVHPDLPSTAGYDGVLEAVEGCLDRLGTDYVDLLYVHWPAPSVYDPTETLAAFDDLVDRGQVRHVGVSNFAPADLAEARGILDAPIATNQVECHPFLQQEELREHAVEHDHWIVAYCPLARGTVFDNPDIVAVAEKHDATPAQVSLAWLLSKENVAIIPGSTSQAHMHENLSARDLELDEEDLDRIDSIDRTHRIIDREYASWNR